MSFIQLTQFNNLVYTVLISFLLSLIFGNEYNLLFMSILPLLCLRYDYYSQGLALRHTESMFAIVHLIYLIILPRKL
jgi:hypothetical protein